MMAGQVEMFAPDPVLGSGVQKKPRKKYSVKDFPRGTIERLGASFQAAPGFAWVPGMRTISGRLVTSVTPMGVTTAGDVLLETTGVHAMLPPDVSHTPTMGALVHMARVRWGAHVMVSPSYDSTGNIEGWDAWCADETTPAVPGFFDSEAECWLAVMKKGGR